MNDTAVLSYDTAEGLRTLAAVSLRAAAGIILGQRRRGAPVAVLRGIPHTPSDQGITTILHRA